ncbi:MAG: CZB domain-containing protein, partial [Bacteroidales bacterium]|nr:CZB domain-containing protein [Bacteroidales bacterium]
MFKQLTIGKKLALGFTVVLLVLCAVVGLSFTGISGIVNNAKETIYGNKLDTIMTQREVDHLNWAAKVNALLTDDKVTHLQVETDDHKCGFGKWLYSEQRKEAESKVPGLAAVLKDIEEPHLHLHESAIEIGETFVSADLHLSAELQRRKCDHLAWMHKVKDVFLDPNKNHVDVQTDD